MKTRVEYAREYRVRQRAKGLCITCPRKLWTKNHCRAHARKAAEYMKAARERKKAEAANGSP